jgi:penicillin amidase
VRSIAGYGPIVTDNGVYDAGSFTLALKWVSVDPDVPDTTFDAFYRLNFNTTDWASFENALSFYVAPAQNFIFADVDGNIGYRMPGKIPVRRQNHTGM